MKKFFFDCGTRDSVASIGIAFLRIATGLMMLLGHGMGKIQSFAEKKDKFPVPDFFPLKFMSPPVSMLAAIGAEAGCAALLVLGLATRPAAFILAFTMTVAAFGIHSSGPFFSASGDGAKEPALMFLIPAVAILLAGAGKYSADASILKEGRRRSRW
ncbi:DoxX family protein [Luteolibacter sp. AS25]|uniref:DoxX family protein n=1 Tax=Luteolibacter sp. AS25 TaxID=3135776 RepID=UPI00398AAB00